MPFWTFERRAKGDFVEMERDFEMRADGEEEAARRAARRTKCLQFVRSTIKGID